MYYATSEVELNVKAAIGVVKYVSSYDNYDIFDVLVYFCGITV